MKWSALGPGLALALSACGIFGSPTPTPPPPCPSSAPDSHEAATILADAGSAVVKTNKGEFTMTLFGDAAPIATANFVLLARCHFYDGVTFHRVVPGFVIQAGDPQTKTRRDAFPELGTGGPGYHFVIEQPDDDLTYDPYVVGMANSLRPDSNGSQFFIDLADLDGQLPRNYTIFGKVASGTEVVDAIGALPTTGPAQDVPLDPAVIETIEIRPETAVPGGPGKRTPALKCKGFLVPNH